MKRWSNDSRGKRGSRAWPQARLLERGKTSGRADDNIESGSQRRSGRNGPRPNDVQETWVRFEAFLCVTTSNKCIATSSWKLLVTKLLVTIGGADGAMRFCNEVY